MTVGLRGTSPRSSQVAQTLTINKPTGTAAGDLMIAHAASERGVTATAAGWTVLRSDNTGGGTDLDVCSTILYRVATSSEPSQYQFTMSVNLASVGFITSWSGVDQDNPIDAHSGAASTSPSANAVAPGLTVTATSAELLGLFSGTPSTGSSTMTATPPAGMSETYDGQASGGYAVAEGAHVPVGSGASGSRTATFSLPARWTAQLVAIRPDNQAPNSPTTLFPIGGASVDRSQPITLSAQFSDPDPGDSPSASQWRYRLVGAATWTTVSQPNPLQTYTIPAGLAAGGYEWQAAYADQQGVWGPFSSSEFFTAQDPPPGPVILDPAAGATIDTDSYTFVFSAPDVDESEFTLYADDGAGNIDTSTIIQGPVTVDTGDVRRHTFTGLVNNVPVWASVRYKYQGLWSQPAQQRNPVSYTPPPSPVVALSVDNPNGALIVSITNPMPGAGEPAASYNSVRIDDGDGKGLTHRIGSQMLALNTPYTYRLAVVGRDYSGSVEVTTTADNGTTSTAYAQPEGWAVDPVDATVLTYAPGDNHVDPADSTVLVVTPGDNEQIDPADPTVLIVTV